MGYLTPNSIPADTICRVLFIPNNAEFIANVTGALQLLLFPENWTQDGTLTPEESASALVDMFDKFCFAVKGCRMIGEIITWAGSSPPDDTALLLCNGSSVSNADYPDLYSVIGTYFGGSGPTDFLLPDLRGSAVIGESSAHAFASTGRSDTVTLTSGEVPSHSHTDLGHTHSEIPALPSVTSISPGVPQPTALPGVGLTGVGSANLTSSGGDGPHDNMQPYLTLNYYIQAL